MERSDYALLGILAAVWGLSYVFYRVGAPPLGPAVFVELRVLLAGGTIALYLVAVGRLRENLLLLRKNYLDVLAVGALNSAIPFTLIAVGELQLPASYSSVLNSTAPLFSVVLGATLLGRPVSGRQVGGVLLGIAGVVILVGAAPVTLTPATAFAIAVTVLAALSYAGAAIFIGRRLPDAPPVALSLGQQIGAAVLVVPLAVVAAPAAHFTEMAWVAVVGIALLSTSFAYAIYFRILRRAGATQALTVTLLMPIFGVLWGRLLLNESIGIGMVAGVALVLAGVGLVTGARFPRRRATPAPG